MEAGTGIEPVFSDLQSNSFSNANKAVAGKEYQDKAETKGEPETRLPNPKIDPYELRFRQMRADAFALAARDCHPDDAAQLATALLIDLSAGMPSGAMFTNIWDDATWWSHRATPPELLAVLHATLDRLGKRALHRTMRKRLFMRLWNSFTPKERADFLTHASGGGSDVR